MQYYQLTNTNLTPSKVALGCMRIADKTIDQIEQLVLAAIDLGINLFDHADIYGQGQSESLFGHVLSRNTKIREKMILQTKCSIVPGKYYDMSKTHILDSVEQSLARLQTDYIDILLMHRPDALFDPKEVVETFELLYQQQKVRYFGVSNFNTSQLQLLQKYCRHPLIINQLQFGPAHTALIDQGIHTNMKNDYAIDYDGGVLNYCQLNNIMIQPWSCLRASLNEPTFLNNNDPRYTKLNQSINKLAQRYELTPSAIVIAWILRHPAQMQPILGTTSLNHLQEICQGIDIQLTREEWYSVYLADKTLP